jgi:prophage DNA circulation protein
MADFKADRDPAFANKEPVVEEVFSQYPIASWTVGKKTYQFPVRKISETGGNRLVQRERPFRDGAKIDDVGSSPVCWSLEVLFQNSLNAEGGSDAEPLYPNVLNAMIRAFATHETGDLVVPTIGKVRARAKTYRRDEDNEARDQALVVFDFVADNEDNLDAAAFALPTVHASVVRLAEATTFSAESDGTFDSTLADLNEFAAQLEAVATFPSDTLQDIDSQAAIVVAATNRVLNAFTSKSNNPTTKARAMLSDPDSSVTQRKLVQLQDTSARARSEIRKNLPPVVRTLFEMPLTIFDIAVLTGQKVEDLIAINPGLDLLFIPERTVVRVYDNS